MACNPRGHIAERRDASPTSQPFIARHNGGGIHFRRGNASRGQLAGMTHLISGLTRLAKPGLDSAGEGDSERVSETLQGVTIPRPLIVIVCVGYL
jgi:hypothetical protein